jgi:hypothetical protein
MGMNGIIAQIPAPRYHLVQWWCGNEEMTVREPLQVRVNDDLVLDAGTYEERPEPARPGAIHPPPEFDALPPGARLSAGEARSAQSGLRFDGGP